MKHTSIKITALISLISASHAASIISMDGTAYSSISASSSLNSSYTPDNLFDQLPTVGEEISATGFDEGFAWAGVGTGPHYVAFQLDGIHSIQSIYYAQRDYTNNHNPGSDKVATIELWASTTAAFTAANPGFAPAGIVTLTNRTDDTFLENQLGTSVEGQYFLLRFTAPVPQTFNSGGTELRLGGVTVPETSTAMLALLAGWAGLRRRR